MGDYERRRHHGGGGHNNRKRRYRGLLPMTDDDDNDHRQQRRRIDSAPLPVRVRRQLLSLAESPLRRWHEEVQSIAHVVADNTEDTELRESFISLVLQLALEQPLKTPFVAGVILLVNTLKPEIVGEILVKLSAATQEKIEAGQWRDVKLYLKLLACLQSSLDGEGIFNVLDELFNRAVDLQTASSDDTIGTELVKIILFTIPYIMAAAPGQWQQKAADLMEKTDIIASEPHALQALIDPYLAEKDEPTGSMSVIALLQKQLHQEAANNWELSCLPRPWKLPLEEIEAQEKLDNATKHTLPAITVPEKIIAGPRPLFPEVYFSVYSSQEVGSVPPVTDIASSLIRDGLVDTINILDYNRNVTARYLIDLDCYFSDTTFVKRATPFDRLRDIESGKSTWKPEDVAVDAVFSQLFQLPTPEHKLVYYHSVLTEACKIAPAAIAPSLGRAIRHMYRNSSRLDLELSQRFVDWFSHHLSNFGFTWKWTEWVDDVFLPDIHPKKAFIIGALDKEIRLSFAQRIKGTLPEPYQPLIGPDKEKDVPDFKFNDESEYPLITSPPFMNLTEDKGTPFSAEGREIASLLRRKAPDEEFQPIIEKIHSLAIEHDLDPLVTSTDVFVTAVCWVGSKSLSHVLACIERTKDRLLDVGAASEAAKAQIITAVMSYWAAQPGVAISIVEKLLNYSILLPLSVIDWALVSSNHINGQSSGDSLAQTHVFELVFGTVAKVTGRVRQLQTEADADDEAKEREVKAMRDLFKAMEDALVSWASGSKDEMMEEMDGAGQRDSLLRRWGERWLRVFRRRAAIEEAFILEASKDQTSGGESASV
ncbi:Nuclear cap-binding protein subunit 1 [Colletotrichum sp. SAR 10_70]|nr:Nuclear cap-binding protein subunit 1 [Colletotrichum sp. SAR 10_71]KAI8174643.1 Nuclear cap-binding protein subunit 1 [Colletotrichum sp. SAR 10_75]KAI8189297.1 Nuclear cap-binding protein subunit 1 [Colletotrichum sp. SAR 10_70]KAI8219340.1 Nuclear cap-binding protein subunit 1 [Colletotrichum sp. SAR 10_86]